MTDPIRATIEAPKYAEGVIEELALELSKMAEAAAADARFGDAHFLSRAASVIQNQHKRLKASAHQPAPPAEALAARPLLEQVARMGDRIGRHTVGEIMAISDRAAAWLAANPPGKPIAIEPRGCPTPGACSCVQPAPLI